MRKTTLWFILLAITLAVPAFAQRTTASICGTVTDSSGAVLRAGEAWLRGSVGISCTWRHQTTVPSQTQFQTVLIARAATPFTCRPLDSLERARPTE